MDIVLDLAYQYQLPLGLQYADEAAVHRKINVKLQNHDLRNVLSTVISRLPEYKMTVGNGLIQIFSPKGRAEASNLLNTRIPDFEVHAVDTHEASADIACSLARQINPRIACFFSLVPGQWGLLNVTLHMHNAKVHEILDAIVAQTWRPSGLFWRLQMVWLHSGRTSGISIRLSPHSSKRRSKG